MRLPTSYALLGALLPSVSAFPYALLEEATRNNPEITARANKILQQRQGGADAATLVFEPLPVFNAEDQYIDVSPGSGHEWQAPTADDLRGPCPGLNAFANHGFLPRNGYATITQFVNITETIVGMGPVLAIFLSTLGATIDGDGTAWSIGGTPTASVAGPLGPMGNGISGSHNKYECDASPTRPDLYEAGNDFETMSAPFNQLISMSPGGVVTLDSLTAFRSMRFDTQIANNPFFFNGPFTGVLVQPAAYTFIYRFMSNHSAENPTGILTYDTLASWFGMSGSEGSYTAVQGHERIPDNWYRRAIEYPYDNVYFAADVLAAAALHPKFLNVGGNMGKPNTFTGLDVANLTGGVFESATLLQGNNLACFAYQASSQGEPDLVLDILTGLGDALGAVVKQLNCPKLTSIDHSQLTQFPGYNRTGASGASNP